MVARIPLTQGKSAIVDDEDVEVLSAFHWQYDRYPVCHRTIAGRSTKVYMHRLLMCASPTIEVDHIDGDPLNNQRANLRLATRKENARNVADHGGTSRLKGVSWDSQTGRWRASITVDGKFLHLGRFDSQMEAAQAYDKAASHYFGIFARPNSSMMET